MTGTRLEGRERDGYDIDPKMRRGLWFGDAKKRGSLLVEWFFTS